MKSAQKEKNQISLQMEAHFDVNADDFIDILQAMKDAVDNLRGYGTVNATWMLKTDLRVEL